MFISDFIFFRSFSSGTCQCRAQEGFRLFSQTQLLVFQAEGFGLLEGNLSSSAMRMRYF